MTYIGERERWIRRPKPTRVTPIEVPNWPQRKEEDAPLEVPNWPQPVKVPVEPRKTG